MQLALASLVPWAAFQVAFVVSDRWTDIRSVNWDEFATVSIVRLGFVALPSAVALLAAKRGWMRAAALVVMTAVAAVAGVLVMTTDDAQAGLAVLWVPITAIRGHVREPGLAHHRVVPVRPIAQCRVTNLARTADVSAPSTAGIIHSRSVPSAGTSPESGSKVTVSILIHSMPPKPIRFRRYWNVMHGSYPRARPPSSAGFGIVSALFR